MNFEHFFESDHIRRTLDKLGEVDKEDFFNAIVKSYTHQGFIDSVHEALQDLQSFPNGLIDPYEDQEQLRERRDLVDDIAQCILFMHP